uniref:Uncharacterized protein n=1 Tax=Caenorhabditis japonica TaxID=281687 RepID=A0A8R1IC03_CAEJA
MKHQIPQSKDIPWEKFSSSRQSRANIHQDSAMIALELGTLQKIGANFEQPAKMAAKVCNLCTIVTQFLCKVC